MPTSERTVGGAPKQTHIQLSEAHGRRVLLTGSSTVTFLTEGAVTWVWGANAKFHRAVGAAGFRYFDLTNSSCMSQRG